MRDMGKAGEFASEAVKAAPPVTISAVSLYGISVADWVSILTIAYLLMLFFTSGPKVVAAARRYVAVIKEWRTGK
ncbi:MULTISPECIES: hypothetical protein [Chromobacterium]|nr:MULTISPECIES: hypothetical protein [Chromobacterium]MBK0415177.1 hypothetical protein [Chromobacterium haemolyticum]MBO0416608.1 hypothetical protein [Chromobacterium haemolyticum]BBH13362.1 hypothetical protein CH06BL_26100 [Chromobacterium haemolyticum]